MIENFPNRFSARSIYAYLILLTTTAILFYNSPMEWYFFAIGLTAVFCFFHFVNVLPKRWRMLSDEAFEKKLFRTAMLIRVVYVIAVYGFYWLVTDSAFDFEAFDVKYYHDCGVNGHKLLQNGEFSRFWTLMTEGDFGDAGYPIWLSIVYSLTGDSILMARLVKAVLGGAMCVLVYRIASRNFDVQTGRLAGIMFMMMPNAIYYCGSHLKEAEMVFVMLLFVERADEMLRAKSITLVKVLGVILLACMMFFFRTALSVVLLLALALGALFVGGGAFSSGKKILVIGALVASGVILAGTGVMQDISNEWDRRHEQEANYEWRAEREGGNTFFAYTSKAVIAPVIFTLPFPTMVGVPGQEHTQMCHGGNFVKNIISFFTIIALIMLFLSGDWKKNVLILAALFGYLIVLAMSQFAQSERFHFPALPFVIILAAYGITHIKRKHAQLFNSWTVLMILAGLAWNYIKLRGRGLI